MEASPGLLWVFPVRPDSCSLQLLTSAENLTMDIANNTAAVGRNITIGIYEHLLISVLLNTNQLWITPIQRIELNSIPIHQFLNDFQLFLQKVGVFMKKLPKMISRPLASFECTGGSPWLAVKHLWKPMKGFGDILWMFRKSESFLKVIERHRCYLLAFIHRPSMSFIQNITIISSVKENC